MTLPPLDILETCLYAEDLDAAERFYGEVLGLRRQARVDGRHVFFRCGERMFLIFNPARTRITDAGVPAHGAVGAGHAAFAVAGAHLDAWRRHLEARGVTIEQDITWPRGGRSLYVRDPAGNSIELASPRLWGIDEPPL